MAGMGDTRRPGSSSGVLLSSRECLVDIARPRCERRGETVPNIQVRGIEEREHLAAS